MQLIEAASDAARTNEALRELEIELNTLDRGTADGSLAELAAACVQLRETHSQFGAAIGDLLDRLQRYAWVRGQVPAEPTHRLATPNLRITCFGRFEVHRADEVLAPCHNRNGQTILRYLVAQPRHREKGDVLMDVLWPDDTPEIARHKLHCATSALRNALNGKGSHKQKGPGFLLHEDGSYALSAAATTNVDADQLLAGYMAGQRAGGRDAVPHYESACALYSGPFLPDDLYADWSHIRREQLSQAYLSMCSALADHWLVAGKFASAADWALRILAENRCDESAYRQLMHACVAQGRRSEAIRQYRRCEAVLATDLGVRPMPETRELFAGILRGDASPTPSPG